MGLDEIVFRIQHDWPLARIFKESQTAVGSLWCNNGERDVIEVKADHSSALKEIRRSLTSLPNYISHHISRIDRSLVTVTGCACYSMGAVASTVVEDDCLLMPPTIFHQGWEHYKVVAMSPTAERKVLQDLEQVGKFEILSKTRILNTGIGGGMRISTLSLFSRLTDRQLQSLLTAYELGYYRSPRQTTTEELAQALRLTRPTYEEHLRKAENKIIPSVAQHLKLLYYRETSVPKNKAVSLRRGTKSLTVISE